MNHKALIGVSLLLLTTACGQSPPPPANDVASLRTTDPAVVSAAATTSPTDSGQPRLRMDMSNEEKQRLYDAHTACLLAADPTAAGGSGPASRRQYSEEAQRACAKLWPLPPWEMDTDNPAFKDNWHRNVQCLNKRGMKVVELEPGSWTYDGEQALGPEDRQRVEKECEQEVFGGGAK
jgi:hypothetical protein